MSERIHYNTIPADLMEPQVPVGWNSGLRQTEKLDGSGRGFMLTDRDGLPTGEEFDGLRAKPEGTIFVKSGDTMAKGYDESRFTNLQNAEYNERQKKRDELYKRELGGLALGNVVGLDDELDDNNARLYTREQIRAMNEQIVHRRNAMNEEEYGVGSLQEQLPMSEREKYLREVFAPELRPETDEDETDYSALFSPSEDVYQAYQERNKVASPVVEAQRKYDRLVNETTRKDALEQLQLTAGQYDPKLHDIISTSEYDINSIETVDAIRNDSELRYKVADYLMKKMDNGIDQNPTEFGVRVVQNSQGNLKTNDITGRKMMSREYAVWLALAQLGGNFNRALEGKNDHMEDVSGRVINGQHRHAARYLLGTSY